MKLNNNNAVAWLLTSGVFIFYLVHALLVDGSYGGGDGIRHYLVSRWSWQHPDQFLYHWGKPFFTFISSPFSQFGLIGIKIFNALIGAFTGFLCYLIGKKLEITSAVFLVVIASFSPVYLLCINSGLTEPLFAFLTVFCIYLYLTEKFLVATIVISFLPFVRSEGNMLIPLFGLILLYRGKWKLIPFLAFGTIAYSIIGYFYYEDIFWIKTKNPYTGSNYDIYGQGELLHYVNAYKLILGAPVTYLFLIGFMVLAVFYLRKPKELFNRSNLRLDETVLILGSFMIYIIAHSIFWWKGLYGSLGLHRSIAGVVPLASIFGLHGVELLFRRLKLPGRISIWIFCFFTIWVILYPFKKDYVPLRLNQEEVLVKEAGLWYNQSEYNKEKVYYLYPYFMHILDLDAFDGERVGELWGLYPAIEEWGIDGPVPLNTIILWDSHFGANEAHISLEKIMNDPNFELLEVFKPEVPFQTLGGYDFEIRAFKRIQSYSVFDSNRLTYDLESANSLSNTHTLTDSEAFSGSKSCKYDAEVEYGILFSTPMGAIPDYKKMDGVEFGFKMLNQSDLSDAVAVFSVERGDSTIVWQGINVDRKSSIDWETVKVLFELESNKFKNDDILKLYVWNKGKSEFYIDDLDIRFITNDSTPTTEE